MKPPRAFGALMHRGPDGRVALAARQHELLCWMIDHRDTHGGVMPSIREMAAALGGVSTNAVNDLLIALEFKGWIARSKVTGRRGRSRSTLVLSDPRGQSCIGCGQRGESVLLARGAICPGCCRGVLTA